MAGLLTKFLKRIIFVFNEIAADIVDGIDFTICYIKDRILTVLIFIFKLFIALIFGGLIIWALPYDMMNKNDNAMSIIMLTHLLIASISGCVIFYKRNEILETIGTFVLIFCVPYLALFFIMFVPQTVFYLRKEINHHIAFENRNHHKASVCALSGMVTTFGKITDTDIDKLRNYLDDHFRSDNIITRYRNAFEFGQRHPEEFKEFAIFIADNYPTVVRIQTMFLLVLIAVNQYQSIDSSTEDFLLKIAFAMGLSKEDFKFFQRCATKQNYHPHEDFNSQSPDMLIKKYRAVLGINEYASFWTIKNAYQQLTKVYDPNRYRNKPREYFYMAENKIREINAAYEYLAEIRVARFDY